MPPGYDDFAETLARGVSAWCRSIDTVEGTATAYIYMSATEIEALAKDDASVERRESAETRYADRGLCVCRFYLGTDTWWSELAEPVPCGSNPWGVVLRGQPGKALEGLGEAPRPAISYNLSDGQETVLYNAAMNRAQIGPSQPGDGHAQPMHSVRESLLLTQGGIALGEALLGLAHGRFPAGATLLVRATKAPSMRGLECWSLQAHFLNTEDEIGRCSVVVSPERGFMPIEFESLLVPFSDRKRGIRHHTRVLAETQTESGIWIPTETTHHWYSYAPGQVSNWRRAQRVRFAELKVGGGAPTFAPVPPLGALVTDYRPGHAGSRWLGGLEAAVRELSSAPPLAPDREFDAPLAGDELNEVFPPD